MMAYVEPSETSEQVDLDRVNSVGRSIPITLWPILALQCQDGTRCLASLQVVTVTLSFHRKVFAHDVKLSALHFEGLNRHPSGLLV